MNSIVLKTELRAMSRLGHGVLRSGLFLAPCCIALLSAIGCDQRPERVPVAGKVLIDGEPVKMGTIRFIPASGRPASADLAEDGSFRVTSKLPTSGEQEIVGLYPGKYKLTVFSSENVSSAENAPVRWYVPKRYADFRTAGLEADIQSPNENLVVELTWEGAEESDEPDDSKETDEADEESTEKTGSEQSSAEEKAETAAEKPKPQGNDEA